MNAAFYRALGQEPYAGSIDFRIRTTPGGDARVDGRLIENDPAVIAMAVLALACAALVAGYLPARWAARIDPTVALRHD